MPRKFLTGLTVSLACVCFIARGQNKKIADSLEAIYSSGAFKGSDKLNLLKELAVNHTDADKKLFFSEQLIQTAKASDSTSYLFQGYLEKGNALRLKSDLSHALESYFEGATIMEAKGDQRRLGAINISIGDVYAIMGNPQTAVKYHRSAIRMLREEKDSINVASALLNAGDAYTSINKLDSALLYTNEAEAIFKKLNSQLGQAYSLGNLGMIYAKLGKNAQAEGNMNKAITILQELHEYYPIAVYLTIIGDIYFSKGDEFIALSYAFKSLEMSRKYGMKDQVSEAYLSLSKIYEKVGNTPEALRYYKSYITYKDSVRNIASVQQMADVRTDFEVSRKQIEVDLLNQQKKTQQIVVIATIVALLLIALLAVVLYRRYRLIHETNLIIDKERNRSEALLLNILPRETAQELKLYGKVQAKRFESVTVMFADFKGFTKYAEGLSPEKVVETVDHYFSMFDEIIEKHGLEKIKTLGDAYMCAGGLPFPNRHHAVSMVRAALDMVEFVRTSKGIDSQNHMPFEIRIGINTGPVVAGIVGTKKFAYDIWGDTVNIASRMESGSEPGRINVSAYTYELVKDQFKCEYRGEIEVKNRGMMKMYFVM